MRRRVVHYVDSDTFGGSEEAALQLMASLDPARWEPVLLHHPDPAIARAVDEAARLGIRARAVPRWAPSRVVGPVPIWRAIRAERPAIFHAHLSWPFACKHGVRAARLAGVAGIVGTAQLFVPTNGRRRPPMVLDLYRRIIAVSEEVRSRYATDLGIAERRLVVVHNAVRLPSTPLRRDADLRAALTDGRPDYVVLTPARLHPQKGHRYLLQAAVQVPGATFVFAGDGPLRPELEGEAARLGLADRCVFLGERSDVPALLAAADLFVLPSLFEGLPLSVLEAMAAERPVIATSIGGTSEAVTSGETGLLVPPRDPDALAAAIRRLRQDPTLGRRLAAAARVRVEREFSLDATARQVMDIYDSVSAEVEASRGR